MRIDFSEKTKEILAARSGYRCSIPACNRQTIGPGASASEVASNGVAAHIFSASPGGPRSQGGLTEDELCLPENGVWLCADHARLVDANRGDAYPPALLLSYKHLQEARSAREQRGIHAPFRWLHEMRLIRTPLLQENQNILFGKLNMIVGDNGTGKTALCEWVSAFATLEWIEGWRSGQTMLHPIIAELSYFDPEPHVAAITIGNDRSLAYQLDGVAVPLSPLPIRVVFPREPKFTDTRGLDDLGFLSKLLSLDAALIQNLASEINGCRASSVRNLRFISENDEVHLLVDVDGTIPGLALKRLSGSEQNRVLIEFAIAICRVLGKYQSTLLILDPHMTSFDKTWFEQYSSRLSDPEIPFQTMAVIPSGKLNINDLRWFGWEVIRAKGTPPTVTLDQNIR